MRKFLPLLLCLGLACNLLGPRPSTLATPVAVTPLAVTPTRVEAGTQPPSPSSPAPARVEGATQPASPRPPTPPSTTVPPVTPPAPCVFQLAPEDVIVHPEPFLYSGDTVSVEVVVDTPCPEWQSATVALHANALGTAPLATATPGAYGLGGRLEATFTWVWNTQQRVGPQTLIVEARPARSPGESLAAPTVVTVTLDILPAGQRPAPESQARWEVTNSACCTFHYISDTAAARDITTIAAQAAAAQDKVKVKLGVIWNKPVDFTMLSRLLGHGGFATTGIDLTYIDRNPVGNNLFTIFTHEQTHILDSKLTAQRPALMAEGLAVYVAGGHFKPNEDLMQRAAALLALGRYIPLGELADNFYPSQHETGYVEGGALVTYLVQTYGWDRFKQFYGSFRSGPDRRVLDAALQANFGKNLSQIEADWLAALRAQPPTPAQVDDLRLSIALYDTLRRYQRLDDPSAYFLDAWVPDTAEAFRRGLVADYVRHPDSAENITIESMLADAERVLEAGQYPQAEALLNSVNAVLESHNLFFDPLAARFLSIVNYLSSLGYEAQSIDLDPTAPPTDAVKVTAIRHWPTLETLILTLGAGGWLMTPAP